MQHWRLVLPLALLALGGWWWLAREAGGGSRGGVVAVEAPAQPLAGGESLDRTTVEAPEASPVAADRNAAPIASSIGAALPSAKLIVVCREQGTLFPMPGISASLLYPS